MPQLIHTSDGVAEFPDSMKPEEIEGVLKQHYATPKDTPIAGEMAPSTLEVSGGTPVIAPVAGTALNPGSPEAIHAGFESAIRESSRHAQEAADSEFVNTSVLPKVPGSNIASQFVNEITGMVTPKNIGITAVLGPAGDAAPVIGRAIAGGFGALGLEQAFQNWKAGNKGAAVADALMGGLGALHAAAPEAIPKLFGSVDKVTPEQRAQAFSDVEKLLTAHKADQSGLPQTAEAIRNEQAPPLPTSPGPKAEPGSPASEDTQPRAGTGQPQGAERGAETVEKPLASDWTSATDDTKPGGGMKLGSGEGGFIDPSIAKEMGDKRSELLRPKMSELDTATAGRSAKLQSSFDEATRAQKEIGSEVPDEKRQNAISVWREAGGDAEKLKSWADAAKGKVFKQAAIDAQNLTPKEQAIGQKAAAALDTLSERGQRYDVLNSHRDNYIPHVWEVENKGTGFGSARLQDKFKFAKARTFDTFFDGDQAGFKPKTLAIGKLLPSYIHEMNKVIADRQFVQDVSSLTAKDGRPLVVPRGNAKTVDSSQYALVSEEGGRAKSLHDSLEEAQAAKQEGQSIEKRESSAALVNPSGFAKAEDATGAKIDQHDYKHLGDQPALSNWRHVATDPNGNATLLKSDLAVHPELNKRLNSMMGQSAIKEWYNEPSTGLSVIPRAIVKNLDTAQSVMKREMFSLLAPFHQVQEGTHAVGHLVNPFHDVPAPDMRNPETLDAVKHGLMLLPEKSSSQNFMEGVGGKGGFVSQIAQKYGGKAGEAVSKTIDGYQDYLFHSYIPGLKIKTYAHILPRNMDRFASELKSGAVTEADVKLLSAQQTNAAYGHLNYALMDRNPTIQHVLQLGLLAPDFLEARGRFVGQALKSLVGEKVGHEQLRAVATLAAFQAAAAYTITSLSGGKYDPKQPFSVIAGGRSYTLRSVPEDMWRLAFSGPQSTREFVSARINPVVQKADQLRTGLNYRGEKTSAMDTIGEALANYIPITARSIPGIRQLTETSRNSPISPLEQLAGSMGVKISRYSPVTSTHELANKWMEKQGIPKQEGIYPTSKFTPLRYALEDADMGRAATEYQKLLKAPNMTPQKLAQSFRSSVSHPFTDSAEHDAQFSSQLKGDDKLLFQHALEVKQGILRKFNTVPDLKAPIEEKAPRPTRRRKKGYTNAE